MPNGVTNNQLLDLLATTLRNLPVNDFEVALKYQRYEAVNVWLKSDRKQLDGGTSIQRNIILSTSGQAKFVLPYEKTEVGVGDVQQLINVNWALARVPWAISRTEMTRNSGGERIIDLIKSKRVDATVDKANLIESRAWSTPDNSSDQRNPLGLPYWIVKMNSTDGASNARGYLGKNPVYGDGTVAANKGGLDVSDASTLVGKQNWMNWAAKYPSATFGLDTVDEMRYAFHQLSFEPPVIATDLKEGPSSMYRIYMNLTTVIAYEKLATLTNDNLGADIGKFEGQIAFNRIPIKRAPILDNDASMPIYFANMYHFFPFVMQGDWMREDDPIQDVAQPGVFVTWLNSQFQFFCRNVRAGGAVISIVS